jgi:hypothetical protein
MELGQDLVVILQGFQLAMRAVLALIRPTWIEEDTEWVTIEIQAAVYDSKGKESYC